jgi:hypothetical protein
VTHPIDPEPKRCAGCDVRLSRVEPDHERDCIRKKNGWRPFEDDPGPTAEEIAAPAWTTATLEARRVD